MVLVESIHGSLREFIITPLIGDSLARQLSFFPAFELFFRHFLILIITSPPVPIEGWRTMDGADVPI